MRTSSRTNTIPVSSRSHNGKSECAKCEDQHVAAVEIVAQHHLPAKVSAKYPPRIDVKMADGTVYVYERRRS